MVRGTLAIFAVCWSTTALAQEAELTPLKTAAELAARVEENNAAFDCFYCEFDVTYGYVKDLEDQKIGQLTDASDVGHGVWAKQGPIELFDFRLTTDSKWDGARRRVGPQAYPDVMLRSPDFELLIRNRGTITSAPDPNFHPSMDPLSLFSMVDGEYNVRLPELLRQFDSQGEAEVDFVAARTPDGRYLRYEVRNHDREVTAAFPVRSPGLPTFVSYGTRVGESDVWKRSRLYVVAAIRFEGGGVFPRRILIIDPASNNWSEQLPADAFLWELKKLERREPTAAELTYVTDRKLMIKRAGIARATYVQEQAPIAADDLPGLYEQLDYKPTRLEPKEE